MVIEENRKYGLSGSLRTPFRELNKGNGADQRMNSSKSEMVFSVRTTLPACVV
jgi:hypothetical protein